MDEKKMLDVIVDYLQPYLGECYSHRIEHDPGSIEIYGQQDEKEYSKFILVRINILHEHKQIHVPNIFLPVPAQGRKIGIGAVVSLTVITVVVLFGQMTNSHK